MARREEYAEQAKACRDAAGKTKNAKDGKHQLGMAEKWEALGRQRTVHKQLERVLAEVIESDSCDVEADSS